MSGMISGNPVNLVEGQTLKKIKVKSAATATTDDVQLERDKRRWKREKQQAVYTSLFWGVTSVFLFGLGISLIVVGVLNDIQDLLILGSIFLVAGVGFIILLSVLVCKPMITRWKNRVTPSNKDDRFTNTSEEITPDDVKKQRKPTAFQLYGENKIIHVPNPKELSDPEFPLPPMVYHPNDAGEEHAAVVQLPFHLKTESELHDAPIS
ncbi:hypothetical protein KP79_PYT05892 [Mizuhopecten yessoensis]|uniref:Uncharacterized protein n=1 Tax=Mizuhopecten yessoensis TaxID=6573 RepID=A0A210QI80_MIZYE|nr:hypothetical protein KP79_PYT05892 [Mizuhopecten yessoensis]